MSFVFVPYTIFLFLSAMITLALAVYAFRRKDVPGARAFALAMLVGITWSLGNALEIMGADLSTKLFWANVQYLCYGAAPLLWFVMVLQFSGHEAWIQARRLILLALVPAISFILAWTDQLHGLLRYDFTLDSSGPFLVIDKEYGPWFFVHFLYAYALNGLSVFYLLRAVWRKNTIYRRQSIFLLFGLGLIIVANVLYVIGLSPFPSIDLSPVVFTVSGAIISWGIFKYQLFRLVPVARSQVIERMATGVIVVDPHWRIVDINPAAKRMFHLLDQCAIGKRVHEYIAELKAPVKSLQEKIRMNGFADPYQSEIAVDRRGHENLYRLYASLIKDYRGSTAAWAFIITDVTGLTQAQEIINEKNKALAARQERDRLAQDLHDNLGQILSFAAIQSQTISRELKRKNTAKAEEYLDRLRRIVQEAHDGLRHYVYDIKNEKYGNHPLSFLLREIGESISSYSKLEIHYSFSSDFDAFFW